MRDPGYRDRVRASRWITAIAVLVGLAAMHGVTASSASAAAPCGVAVAHVHGDVPIDSASLGPTLSTPMPVDPDHAGMACLVILLAGVVLALTLHRRRDGAPDTTPVPRALVPTRAGRGPPLLLLSCVSRT